MNLWHAYSAIDAEKFVLIVAGPVDADQPRFDGQRWQDSFLTEGPHSHEPLLLDFITSLDHEPSTTERLHLVPEDYRSSYIKSLAEALLSQQSTSVVSLTEDESLAIFLAAQDRLQLLKEVVNTYEVLGCTESDRKLVKASKAQIEALVTSADKLKLRSGIWPI